MVLTTYNDSGGHMNELSNIANAVGTYKNILTTITSNRCNVQLVNKLTISK
jgi:hypothetical protein